MIAHFTAAHPLISHLLILWLVGSLIGAGIWSRCKERTREDEEPVRDEKPDQATRPVLDYEVTFGPASANTVSTLRSYTPPTFTGKASKGFRRAS